MRIFNRAIYPYVSDPSGPLRCGCILICAIGIPLAIGLPIAIDADAKLAGAIVTSALFITCCAGCLWLHDCSTQAGYYANQDEYDEIESDDDTNNAPSPV